MHLFIGNDYFELSDTLISAIIRAIDKAVSEDVPNQLRSMPLETNNYIRQMRGDWINQNLRDLAVMNGSMLHSFRRFSWNGRILVDRDSRLTISITTQNNLLLIPRKSRQRPHFLQSILHELNGDLHGHYEQMRFFDTAPFEDETYAKDFADISNGAFDPAEGFRHCVIAYNTLADELVDVKLVVFDPYFNTVTEESLADYINPDFARLTESAGIDDSKRTDHNAATRRLSSLKPGIKPSIREKEKEG